MANHYKFKLQKPARPWERLVGKFLSDGRISEYKSEVKKILQQDKSVNSVAFHQWSLGWLSENFPEDDIATLIIRRLDHVTAANEIKLMIDPYNDACQKLFSIFNELNNKRNSQHPIPDWILVDWIHTMCVGGPISFIERHSRNNTFQRPSAASELFEIIDELYESLAESVQEKFEEAERKSQIDELNLQADEVARKARELFLQEKRR
jgi:hypothetical protein